MTTPAKDFVHLHTHSDHSMLDGMSKVKSIVRLTEEMNQKAVAITDHGNVGNIPFLFKECGKRGIKAIPAVEAYHVKDMHDKTAKEAGEKAYNHLILIATSNVGYKNLIRLTSISHTEGYYGKPRMDNELIAQYSEGLVGTSACLGGVVNQFLVKGDYKSARSAAAELADIFGKDKFFIEVQNHGIKDQIKILPDQVRLAKDIGVGLVAANDSHYDHPEDADVHDSLLCIQTGSMKTDIDRFGFDGDGANYFRSSQDMWDLFPEEDFPGACANTLKIADMVEMDDPTKPKEYLIPKFPVPKEYRDSKEMLRALAYEGTRKFYGNIDGAIPQNVIDRTESELTIIDSMGYNDYTLIVADAVRWAKSQGIAVGPGRGSGAGSIVNYDVEITAGVDPLEHGLYFERYLNPGRRSMPDIDIDIESSRRDEVIDYMLNKYGKDRVSLICTWVEIKGLTAIQDSTRVLGHPIHLGERIKMEMPGPVDQYQISVKEALASSSSGLDAPAKNPWRKASGLRSLYNSDSSAAEILDLACRIEGTIRTTGKHTAGLLVSPGPLTDNFPLFKPTDDGMNTVQFDKDGAEGVGGLKLDFLGLKNLTIITNCLRMIKNDTGRVIEPFNVSTDDPAVYKMLADGHTSGVFQINKEGMTDLIKLMKVDKFADISAALALYRPGPMGVNSHTEYAERKNGRSKVQTLHPEMDEILKDSYGLVVYQEEVMALSQKFAGFDASEADDFRKAMGKKDKIVMEQQHQKFLDGCEKNGYSKELGQGLWDIIEPFADYAFNKAHTVAYAVITYMTAWLKYHYPSQYIAACMGILDSVQMSDLISYGNERGIVISSPDVNKSQYSTSTYEGNVWLGFSNVKGCGQSACTDIIAARAEGPFDSLQDFLLRTGAKKNVASNLIVAGAFDSLHANRRAMVDNLPEIIPAAKSVAAEMYSSSGQDDIFGLSEGLDTVLDSFDLDGGDTFSQSERRAHEFSVLGMFAGKHPYVEIQPLVDALKKKGSIPKGAYEATDSSAPIDKAIPLYGVLGATTTKKSKNGSPRTEFWVETGFGTAISAILFGMEISEKLRGSLVLCEGTIREEVSITQDPETGEDLKTISRKLIATSVSKVNQNVSSGQVRRSRLSVVAGKKGEGKTEPKVDKPVREAKPAAPEPDSAIDEIEPTQKPRKKTSLKVIKDTEESHPVAWKITPDGNPTEALSEWVSGLEDGEDTLFIDIMGSTKKLPGKYSIDEQEIQEIARLSGAVVAKGRSKTS